VILFLLVCCSCCSLAPIGSLGTPVETPKCTGALSAASSYTSDNGVHRLSLPSVVTSVCSVAPDEMLTYGYVKLLTQEVLDQRPPD
jgi:hypothetical protein